MKVKRKFLLALIIVTGCSFFLVFAPVHAINSFFELEGNDVSHIKFKLYILLIVAINFVISVLVEHVIDTNAFKRFTSFLKCKKRPKNLYKRIDLEINENPNWPPINTLCYSPIILSGQVTPTTNITKLQFYQKFTTNKYSCYRKIKLFCSSKRNTRFDFRIHSTPCCRKGSIYQDILLKKNDSLFMDRANSSHLPPISVKCFVGGPGNENATKDCHQWEFDKGIYARTMREEVSIVAHVHFVGGPGNENATKDCHQWEFDKGIYARTMREEIENNESTSTEVKMKMFIFLRVVILMFCRYCGAVRRHLEDTDVDRAIWLFEYDVWQVEVVRWFAVSQSVVSRMWERYQQTGLYHDRPYSGRPVL
ncbi:hypothetical protein GQR58_015779 [Nymphon striatum]|nr:hypothetical protein GQR58_015779 [Nymphon striatum]